MAPDCATHRVYLTVMLCPEGVPLMVHRTPRTTLVAVDPYSTRDDIAAASFDELTPAEMLAMRRAYGVALVEPGIPERILGPVGSLCDRRIPHALRLPGCVDLPHRRRLSDAVSATA